MEENIDTIFADYPLGEKCIIIHYLTETTKGKYIILESLYNKKQARIKRAFKNCEIVKLIECVLTEEILVKEFINYEVKRVYGSQES